VSPAWKAELTKNKWDNEFVAGAAFKTFLEKHIPEINAVMKRIPSQPSMDGNSVDSDVELSQFTKNSVFTEAALTFLGGTIRSRMSAITGQPS